jgi:hypothetical protein
MAVATGFAMMLTIGLCVAPGLARITDLGLSRDTYEAIAQVAATLLVAFSVEMAVGVRSVDADRAGEKGEGAVGYLVGVALGGVSAIVAAFACAERSGGELGFSFAWEMLSGVAIGGTFMLGVLVAAFPWFWWGRSPGR